MPAASDPSCSVIFEAQASHSPQSSPSNATTTETAGNGSSSPTSLPVTLSSPVIGAPFCAGGASVEETAGHCASIRCPRGLAGSEAREDEGSSPEFSARMEEAKTEKVQTPSTRGGRRQTSAPDSSDARERSSTVLADVAAPVNGAVTPETLECMSTSELSKDAFPKDIATYEASASPSVRACSGGGSSRRKDLQSPQGTSPRGTFGKGGPASDSSSKSEAPESESSSLSSPASVSGAARLAASSPDLPVSRAPASAASLSPRLIPDSTSSSSAHVATASPSSPRLAASPSASASIPSTFPSLSGFPSSTPHSASSPRALSPHKSSHALCGGGSSSPLSAPQHACAPSSRSSPASNPLSSPSSPSGPGSSSASSPVHTPAARSSPGHPFQLSPRRLSPKALSPRSVSSCLASTSHACSILSPQTSPSGAGHPTGDPEFREDFPQSLDAISRLGFSTASASPGLLSSAPATYPPCCGTTQTSAHLSHSPSHAHSTPGSCASAHGFASPSSPRHHFSQLPGGAPPPGPGASGVQTVGGAGFSAASCCTCCGCSGECYIPNASALEASPESPWCTCSCHVQGNAIRIDLSMFTTTHLSEKAAGATSPGRYSLCGETSATHALLSGKGSPSRRFRLSPSRSSLSPSSSAAVMPSCLSPPQASSPSGSLSSSPRVECRSPGAAPEGRAEGERVGREDASLLLSPRREQAGVSPSQGASVSAVDAFERAEGPSPLEGGSRGVLVLPEAAISFKAAEGGRPLAGVCTLDKSARKGRHHGRPHFSGGESTLDAGGSPSSSLSSTFLPDEDLYGDSTGGVKSQNVPDTLSAIERIILPRHRASELASAESHMVSREARMGEGVSTGARPVSSSKDCRGHPQVAGAPRSEEASSLLVSAFVSDKENEQEAAEREATGGSGTSALTGEKEERQEERAERDETKPDRSRESGETSLARFQGEHGETEVRNEETETKHRETETRHREAQATASKTNRSRGVEDERRSASGWQSSSRGGEKAFDEGQEGLQGDKTLGKEDALLATVQLEKNQTSSEEAEHDLRLFSLTDEAGRSGGGTGDTDSLKLACAFGAEQDARKESSFSGESHPNDGSSRGPAEGQLGNRQREYAVVSPEHDEAVTSSTSPEASLGAAVDDAFSGVSSHEVEVSAERGTFEAERISHPRRAVFGLPTETEKRDEGREERRARAEEEPEARRDSDNDTRDEEAKEGDEREYALDAPFSLSYACTTCGGPGSGGAVDACQRRPSFPFSSLFGPSEPPQEEDPFGLRSTLSPTPPGSPTRAPSDADELVYVHLNPVTGERKEFSAVYFRKSNKIHFNGTPFTSVQTWVQWIEAGQLASPHFLAHLHCGDEEANADTESVERMQGDEGGGSAWLEHERKASYAAFLGNDEEAHLHFEEGDEDGKAVEGSFFYDRNSDAYCFSREKDGERDSSSSDSSSDSESSGDEDEGEEDIFDLYAGQRKLRSGGDAQTRRSPTGKDEERERGGSLAEEEEEMEPEPLGGEERRGTWAASFGTDHLQRIGEVVFDRREETADSRNCELREASEEPGENLSPTNRAGVGGYGAHAVGSAEALRGHKERKAEDQHARPEDGHPEGDGETKGGGETAVEALLRERRGMAAVETAEERTFPGTEVGLDYKTNAEEKRSSGCWGAEEEKGEEKSQASRQRSGESSSFPEQGAFPDLCVWTAEARETEKQEAAFVSSRFGSSPSSDTGEQETSQGGRSESYDQDTDPFSIPLVDPFASWTASESVENSSGGGCGGGKEERRTLMIQKGEGASPNFAQSDGWAVFPSS
ncbi:hypothetical protein TGVAND_203150 [Toxoplasma gondii VAND]|uniref:Uncharacterized protein n=1 Tax=Toxoplasma gondii VAND TaxID=933077 RepID=A0A086Q3F4_TOXGO|nr:hypothetical protein TGVAND_203150 [Toxoplasma gondii VAND]